MNRPALLAALVVALASCAGPATETSTTSTQPQAFDAVWQGDGYDLHVGVTVSASVTPGVSGRPLVAEEGEDLGPGLLTAWVDAATPEAVADMAGADCEALDPLLDRWSDVLYRLDVSDADRAQADAYLGFGMDRVTELGCDYEVDLEGRATPFP